MDALLDAALEYASRGWAVFPLQPNGKKPTTSNGFYAATTDPEQIRAWWTQTPDANVGLPTGAINGISVVDEDVKDGAKGAETLAALLAHHGASLDAYAQTRTWSGGRHIVCAYDELAKQGVGCYGPGLDGRNDGGYIVAPPSVIEGQSYQWIIAPDTLLPFPGWLRSVKPSSNGNGAHAEAPDWADALMLAGVDKGERDDQAWRLICHAREAGKSKAECIVRVTLFGSRCRPPFDPATDTNIMGKIDRAYAKPPATAPVVTERPWPEGVPPWEAEATVEAVDPGGERFSDYMNATRTLDHSDGALRHADEMGAKWMHAGPVKWAVEFPGVVKPYAQRVARLYYEQGAEIERLANTKDPDAMKRAHQKAEIYRRAGLRMESAAGIASMIECLKDLPGIRCSITHFDAHPYWLNTQTGTVDLETGEAWDHRASDLFTKVTGAGFEPSAFAPTWDAFLERVVPNADTRAFLQRSIGYCLSDSMAEQCMWFLYGLGRNGKSTFLNVIRKALGDYAMTTQASTLMVKRQGDERRNDIAVLKGARLVTATEAEDGQHLAEALIKEVTGEDPVTCRLLYAEYFTFAPTFKIWLAANHKPMVKGQDLAIWRRIHLVPFEQTIPANEVDRGLPAKLGAELDGILAWAYRGWLAYREVGLDPPREVTEATAAYRAEMDPLADFLEDACLTGKAALGAYSASSALYGAYREWATEAGINHPMTMKRLGKELRERGYEPKMDGHGRRGWLGIKPKREAKAF